MHFRWFIIIAGIDSSAVPVVEAFPGLVLEYISINCTVLLRYRDRHHLMTFCRTAVLQSAL
jgi:hypothetical protein